MMMNGKYQNLSFHSRPLMRIVFFLLFLALLLFVPVKSDAQDVNVSYRAMKVPLSKVLSELSARYNIKYAFDPEVFNKMMVTITINNKPIEDLHLRLAKNYPLRFRMVEGTWIVVKTNQTSAGIPEQVENDKKESSRIASGFVFDGITGEPLVYCNLFFKDQRGTITNNLGFFQIETPEEFVEVTISHLGYHRIDTIIPTNTRKPFIIRLQPFVVLMEEVRILQKEKTILELGEFSEKIGFNPAQSASLPSMSNDDLVNMLSVIPGLNYLNGVGGGISVRGGDPSENLVILDGIPLLETGHLLGNISMLNANFIRQAFVSRGGFDASFGDRSAGLIELSGKSGPITHPTIDLSANLLNSNIVANIPVVRKINFSGAWRRSFLNEWPNHLSKNVLKESRVNGIQDLSVEVFPAVFYDDLNLKANFFPSENHMFSIGYMRGNDYQTFDYEIGGKNMIFQNDQKESFNQGYSFNWHLQTGQWTHNFTAAYTELHQTSKHESGRQIVVDEAGPKKPKKNPKANPNPNSNNSNRNKLITDNDSNKVNEFRIDLKTEFRNGIFSNQTGLGYTGNYFDYHYFARRTQGNIPVDSVSKSNRQDIAHIFVQQVIGPVSGIKLRWGIRTNYNIRQNKFYVQPRGGFEYLSSGGMKTYYHSGVYRQFLSRAPKIDAFGNIDRIWMLPDSMGTGLLVSYHHIFGLKYEKGGLLINGEIYSRNTKGKQSFYARQYRKGSINRIQYVQYGGREFNKGMDLFLQFRNSFLTHQLSWSFSDSREQINGFYNDQFFPSLNSHRHLLNINEIFSYKGWNLSASWNFKTGRPVIVNGGNDNMTFVTLKNYSQLDIGLVRTFSTRKFSATGGASLLNVLNRSNIIGVDYLNIFSESNSYSIQTNIGSIGFTPVFFLRLQVL